MRLAGLLERISRRRLLHSGARLVPREIDRPNYSPADQRRYRPQGGRQCEIGAAPREQRDDAQDQENEAKDECEGCAQLVKRIYGPLLYLPERSAFYPSCERQEFVTPQRRHDG